MITFVILVGDGEGDGLSYDCTGVGCNFGNVKVTISLYVNNHSLLFLVFGCPLYSITLHPLRDANE